MDLIFESIPRRVRLIECAELLPLMREIIRSWPFHVAESDAASDPIITVRVERDGCCRIDAPWLDRPVREETAVCVVCSLIIELVYAWFEAHPSALCMHCGAVEMAGRLVVFPSTNRAGKSTLIARLAADGMNVYADDLLPLMRDGKGMSLGMQPRLRRPLPKTAGAALTRFVRANAGPCDSRYMYLALSPPRLAPFGNRSLIGAFVFLERQKERKAELTPVSHAAGLQHVLRQNFIRPGSAGLALDQLLDLVEARPCYRLVYSDLDEAADLLRVSFASGLRDTPAPSAANRSARRAAVPVERADRSRISGALYIRDRNAIIRDFDGEAFLVAADQETILSLNPTARAIWQMLANPLSEAEAAALMRDAFPHLESRMIRRDIRLLFAELRKRGLIRSVSPVSLDSLLDVEASRPGPV